jgi:hypothetical protein
MEDDYAQEEFDVIHVSCRGWHRHEARPGVGTPWGPAGLRKIGQTADDQAEPPVLDYYDPTVLAYPASASASMSASGSTSMPRAARSASRSTYLDVEGGSFMGAGVGGGYGPGHANGGGTSSPAVKKRGRPPKHRPSPSSLEPGSPYTANGHGGLYPGLGKGFGSGKGKGGGPGRPRKQKADTNCSFCLQTAERNKAGEPERMVSCHLCGRSGHPSCLNMKTARLRRMVFTYEWTCNECKVCEICSAKGDDVSGRAGTRVPGWSLPWIWLDWDGDAWLICRRGYCSVTAVIEVGIATALIRECLSLLACNAADGRPLKGIPKCELDRAFELGILWALTNSILEMSQMPQRLVPSTAFIRLLVLARRPSRPAATSSHIILDSSTLQQLQDPFTRPIVRHARWAICIPAHEEEDWTAAETSPP